MLISRIGPHNKTFTTEDAEFHRGKTQRLLWANITPWVPLCTSVSYVVQLFGFYHAYFPN